jgi:PAS domain S-box-containing protein
VSEPEPTIEELRAEVRALREGLAGLEHAEAARRQAEEQLGRSEHFLAVAEHVAHLGCWEWDLHTNRLTWSAELYRLYGLTPGQQDLTYEGYLQRVHPDDRATLQQVVERTCRDGQPFSVEERILRADGAVRVLRSMGEVALDEGGRPVRMRGVCQDVTERHRAEEGLAERERLYREAIEAAGAVPYARDYVTGRFDYVGPGIRALLGHAPEAFTPEVWNRCILEIQPFGKPTDLSAEEATRWLRSQEVPGWWADLRVRTAGGEERWLTNAAVKVHDERGQLVGSLGLWQDITARRRAEERLRQREAQLAEAQRVAHIGSWEWDVPANAIAWTDELYRIYGLPPGGRPPRAIFDERCHPDDQAAVRRVIEQALADGRPFEFEHRVVLPDGQTKVVHGRGEVAADAAGRPARLIGTVQEVTEQRRLEEQLRQAHKMEAVGQLAGGIAHDFNNLLTAILGNLSLLQPNLPPSGPGRESLEAAEQAARRAAELTSQLLGFSRRTLMRPRPTDPAAVIHETVRLLRRTIDPRVVVEVRSGERLGMVHADPAQLNQVLMNLCLNARDAMPEGGRLRVEADAVEVDAAHVRLHPEARAGTFVRLRVSDTGHGIPPEVRPRIFEPFFTTKEVGRGTGLGLAMVFGIVRQHDGWVECASEVGRGTVFDVFLPRSEAGAPVEEEPPAARGPAGGSETILLVDDEAMLRNLGRAILESHGYRVLVAEDGLQAVAVYQHARESIDLVVLDLTMPRLSGRDALKCLYRINPRVRVLFASGYTAEQAAEHECVLGFVGKPYRAEDLAGAVRRALNAVGTAARPGSPPGGTG